MTEANAALMLEAEALAARGKTYREIARELDVPRMTVYTWLPDKVVLHGEEQFVEMAKLRMLGLTNREIGVKLGVHRTRVNAVLGKTPRFEDQLLSRSSWRNLAHIAKALGIHRGAGTNKGTSAVTVMLSAIANGEIDLHWKPGHGPMAPPVENSVVKGIHK